MAADVTEPAGEATPDVPVAVIGAGRMGAAMVTRLRAGGYPVTVFNRTRERAEAAAGSTGAAVAGTAREAAEAAQVVLVSLADDAAVRSAYAGPDGLALGLTAGVVVLECSTLQPETVHKLAPLVTERGAALLDTPVSGSVPLVLNGQLTVLAGGDPAAVERARPVLDALASKVFHLGDLGAGATMKLAVNSVLIALNQALSEALVLAERAGVEREQAYEVFANSAVAAPYVQYKRDAFVHPETTPAAFLVDLVAKDLWLVDALATRHGVRADQLAANRRVVAGAVAAGFGGNDISSIAEYLRTQSG
ncbi:MAG: NAD(P)-dependent oxidoreductase [Micromonosporaceae bacterium]|nr:NAD(P)-dependent oxidoreductase [Micromonosporaceae bacterium]